MCSRTATTRYTGNCSAEIERLREALDNADSVIIGAGAGLSTSAGFTYTGERFEIYFADFEKKYGFHDMYSGGFYPYKTPEENWAFWSRYIYINRYMDPPKPVYENLRKLVESKAMPLSLRTPKPPAIAQKDKTKRFGFPRKQVSGKSVPAL